MRRALVARRSSLAARARPPAATATRADGPATVFAAASLTDVFPKISPASALPVRRLEPARAPDRARRAGRRLRLGEPVYTQDLYRNGLVEKPRTFATNSLVLAVPRSNPAKIRTVFDLAKRPKLKLVVAGQKVPIGLYTREVLKRLGLLRVLRKVVSQEPDVKGIVGKLALGEADAGFVYATDVRAASSRLDRDPAAERSQPTVRYEIAVVKGADRAARPRSSSSPTCSSTDGRRELRAGRLRRSREKPVRRPRSRSRPRVALAFLLLPIVAIFLDIPPGQLLDGIERPGAVDALVVTLKTNADRERR